MHDPFTEIIAAGSIINEITPISGASRFLVYHNFPSIVPCGTSPVDQLAVTPRVLSSPFPHTCVIPQTCPFGILLKNRFLSLEVEIDLGSPLYFLETNPPNDRLGGDRVLNKIFIQPCLSLGQTEGMRQGVDLPQSLSLSDPIPG